MKKILFFLGLAIITICPIVKASDTIASATRLALDIQRGDQLRAESTKAPEAGEIEPNIDALDSLGRTALHRACLRNDHKAVWELLRQDANINIPDYNGKFPIDLTTNKQICCNQRQRIVLLRSCFMQPSKHQHLLDPRGWLLYQLQGPLWQYTATFCSME